MDCKLDAVLVVESKDMLRKEYEDDICCYMDCVWDSNWMSYKDGYVILNCEDGLIYYVIFK